MIKILKLGKQREKNKKKIPTFFETYRNRRTPRILASMMSQMLYFSSQCWGLRTLLAQKTKADREDFHVKVHQIRSRKNRDWLP